MANNFKSAFESIPGRDALLQYEDRNYPNRTYVERNGLIFKSITATSENFLLSQWELIGDLREVRVPNIAARNSLTGTTGTSYGVHTPILDNTNVLVLDASADPQVGSAQFARYNYNQGNASWLLLQVGTGSTSASTSIEYSNVLNRPFVVSGVTVNAGAGLAGGGSVFGSIPAAGGIINLAHADTSSQANLTLTGRTYVQQLKFDTYGHVTGATQSTWTHPDTSSQANVLNTGRTYIQSISVDGDGHIVSLSSSVWTHPDTSTQANSVNVGNTFIQSIYLDGDGHVVGLGTGVAAGGGGGGSPLTYNGNSGGALTMNSGATLNITGGTNILTVRTGNAANPGLRINVNPSGLNGQVQYNSAGTLGASANFVFSAGTSTLRSSNYVVGALPAIGIAATDQFLTRNPTSGVVQRLDIGSITTEVFNNLVASNGLSKTGNVIRLGGTLTGHTSIGGVSFDLTFTPRSITIGSRGSGTPALNSFTIGVNNIVTGQNSIASGQGNNVGNLNSYAGGTSNTISGTTGGVDFVFGDSNKVGSNIGSTHTNFAIGRLISLTGSSFNSGGLGTLIEIGAANAFAIGNYIKITGSRGVGIGGGDNAFSKALLITGQGAIAISNNAYSAQITGHGALAQYSSIFGGVNHNIETGNTRATIVGSNGTLGIKLTGSSYVDHTAVGNLAIMVNPALGINGDDVLVRSSTTGRIRRVTQASLGGIPANLGSILYVSVTGNNATAVPGNISKPYQTIQAAISTANSIAGKSATNRALVYVLPGSHSIPFSTTMPNFVDLFLMPGAVVTALSTTAFSYTNVDSNIYGFGTFNKTVATGNFIAVANCKQANNRSMTIEGDYSAVNASSGSFISVTNSNLKVKFNNILVNGTSASYGSFSVGSDATLEFDEFVKSGSSGAYVVANGNGGTSKLKIYGNRVRTEAFFFQNYLGDSELYIDDIISSGGGVIDFRSTSRTKFRGKINHTGTFAPLVFTDNTAKAYIMPGTCVITSFTYSTNSFSVSPGAQLFVYDTYISNKPVNAALVTTVTGSVTVNASIDF